jgi:hypothetical protein
MRGNARAHVMLLGDYFGAAGRRVDSDEAIPVVGRFQERESGFEWLTCPRVEILNLNLKQPLCTCNAKTNHPRTRMARQRDVPFTAEQYLTCAPRSISSDTVFAHSSSFKDLMASSSRRFSSLIKVSLDRASDLRVSKTGDFFSRFRRCCLNASNGFAMWMKGKDRPPPPRKRMHGLIWGGNPAGEMIASVVGMHCLLL